MYKRKHYEAGEKSCEVCGKELPAFDCWPGRTHFYCDTSECRREVQKRTRIRTISAYEKPCSRPGCTGFAPAGNYEPTRLRFYCSEEECEKKSWFLEVRITTCTWCGKEIHRPKRPNVTNNFCCPEHHHLFRSEHLISERAGIYFPLLTEYVDGFVSAHYRKPYGARNALSYFFQFLTAEKVDDIKLVSPKLITRFIASELRRGGIPTKYVSFVSTFFDWMIAEDRFDHANPVVPRIHHAKTPKHLPRPYSEEEMTEIWRLLDERGNNRVRLAMAIGEETGLRIGEVVNLRVQDVNLQKQTVFVQLPNKSMNERSAHFHEKTRKYFAAWMAERNPNCGHDLLLHNTRGGKCTQVSLQLEFRRVLCIWERKDRVKANDTGLDTFSFHRLRHTMASRLVSGGADAAAVMSQGGWATASAMFGYARVEPDRACRSYNEAMERARTESLAPRQRTKGFRVYREREKDAA